MATVGTNAARIGFALLMSLVIIAALSPPVGSLFLPGSDKVQHFFAFFGLSTMAALGWNARHYARIGAGLILLGGTLELLQASPIISRDAEILDFTADTGGTLAAIILAYTLNKRIRRHVLNRRR